MTLRLILIRHAKSNWGDPSVDDHARPLNGRGRASAQAIGKWLATVGYVPELLLCSDALRAQETAGLILPTLDPAPRLNLSRRLYHAAPATIFDHIKHETAGTIAVIGHNPGLGILAGQVVRETPDHPRFADYPTGATTVISFDAADWGAIKQDRGTCIDFIVPRDLIDMTDDDSA